MHDLPTEAAEILIPGFSPGEQERYARHFNLPDFGPEKQNKLKQARVLVIGVGGLGAPLIQYLAAAGVGTLGLVDYDRISASNLQRQVLFTTQQLGRWKAEVAAEYIHQLNPWVKTEVHLTAFQMDNALSLVSQYDIIADGSDNFATRYLVNDACVLANKPLVYASVFRYEGQVTVFNLPGPDGPGINYRNLYPTPPPPVMVPSCAEGGVLGVLPGIIGSIQAAEIIKLITGIGTPLAGKLFLLDAASMQSRTIQLPHAPPYPVHHLEIPDGHCLPALVREISVTELHNWKQANREFQLIDVRKEAEKKMFDLGGVLIPHTQILEHLTEIRRDIPVVFYCHSGQRSNLAISQLQDFFEGSGNFWNLQGGVEAWQILFGHE
ncbi:MAG: molybdopterin-synthase adenylyltransferase MoeB [Lewinellaceae bacterium]|nr:molybdopterin-synthase adenylyltransferase MoeB [Lewinellaceae bacterium]